jgi:transketolase
LPVLDRSQYGPAGGVRRGAYVLADTDGEPDVLLLASGSEVPLCLDARDQLARDGIKARVVSMPSWELFEREDRAYQDSVIPPSVTARVAVEQAVSLGWERWVGRSGEVIGMDTFGASAPITDVQKHFGFTTDNVIAAAKRQVKPGS